MSSAQSKLARSFASPLLVAVALMVAPAIGWAQTTINLTVPYQVSTNVLGYTILALMDGNTIDNTCTIDPYVIALVSPPQYGTFTTEAGTFVFTGPGPCNGVTGPTVTVYYEWTDPASVGSTDSLTFTGTYSPICGSCGANTYSVNITLGSAPCSITSTTVAQQPPKTDRKILGVGEEVSLTLNNGDDSTTWQLEGPGSIAPNGENTTYIADDGSTGVATITANANTCTEPVKIRFAVIAPSKVTMTNPQHNYIHTFLIPDIGFVPNVYIGPDTVSFYNAFFQEANVQATATGVYSSENGEFHCGTGQVCPVVSGTNTVASGLGTFLTTDCVDSGNPGVLPPYKPGSISLTIPWQWFLNDTDHVTFENVDQTATLESNGTLTASKAGVVVTKSVFSPNGNVTCSN